MGTRNWKKGVKTGDRKIEPMLKRPRVRYYEKNTGMDDSHSIRKNCFLY